MGPSRAALIVGLTIFSVLITVAYAGADHPPPPGFWVGAGVLALWVTGVACASVREIPGPTVVIGAALAAVGLSVVLAAVQGNGLSWIFVLLVFGVSAVSATAQLVMTRLLLAR